MADPRPDFSLRTRTARQAGEGAAFSPLYRQIKDLLVQSLERGEWMPGELIPSEIDLAARFQVSQGTVRKAVDELAAEHMLLRRQGKGTFVATHHEPRCVIVSCVLPLTRSTRQAGPKITFSIAAA